MGLFDIFTESGRTFDWLYENYFEATEIAYRVMRGGISQEISLNKNKRPSPISNCKVIIGKMSSDSLTRDISNDYKRKLADIADEIRVIDLYLDEEKRKQEIIATAEKYKRAFLYFCKKEGASPSFFFKMTSCPIMPGERVFKSFSKANQKTNLNHDDHFQNLVTDTLAKYGYEPCIGSRPFTPSISFSSLGLTKLWVQPMSLGIRFPYGITKDLDFKIKVEPFSENSNISSLYPHLSEFESIERKITELVERESLWKQFEDNILSHKFACRYYRGYFKETYGTEDVSLDKYEALVKNVAPLNAFIQKQERDYDYLRKQYPFGIKEFEKRHPEIPHTEYLKHASAISWFESMSMSCLFPDRQIELSNKLSDAVSGLSGWNAFIKEIEVECDDYDLNRFTAFTSRAYIHRYLTYGDNYSMNKYKRYYEIDKSTFKFCSDIFDNTLATKNLTEWDSKIVLNELNSVLAEVIPAYLNTFQNLRIVLAGDLWNYLGDECLAKSQIRRLPALEEFNSRVDVIINHEFDERAAGLPHLFLALETSPDVMDAAAPNHILSSFISISLGINYDELMRIEGKREQDHREKQKNRVCHLKSQYPYGFRTFCVNLFGTDDESHLSYDIVIAGENEIRQIQWKEDERIREAKRQEEERQIIFRAAGIAQRYPIAFRELCPSVGDVDTLAKANSVIAAERRIIEFDSIYCKKDELFEHQRFVCGLPHKYFYDYYSKKKYGDNVSPEAAYNRSYIWLFKDGLSQQRAVSLVVDFLKASKIAAFGGRIIFACIPASDPFTNRSRYEWFSAEVCKNLGFRNAFEHIRVCSSVTPRRMGGTRMAELDIDREFFKDSFVLLFDDVVTYGTTASNRKSLIEAAGAYCIGIISLGKTV